MKSFRTIGNAAGGFGAITGYLTAIVPANGIITFVDICASFHGIFNAVATQESLTVNIGTGDLRGGAEVIAQSGQLIAHVCGLLRVSTDIAQFGMPLNKFCPMRIGVHKGQVITCQYITTANANYQLSFICGLELP